MTKLEERARKLLEDFGFEKSANNDYEPLEINRIIAHDQQLIEEVKKACADLFLQNDNDESDRTLEIVYEQVRNNILNLQFPKEENEIVRS